MHGSIGPSCAIAMWKNDFLTVWSHTQGVYPLRQSLSNLLTIPEEKIRVIGVPGSGCYGHNGADDVAADAALVAMEMPGKPVRVQWMREDEHRWEPYGSAMVMNLKAGIGATGKVVAWKTELWSDTHSTRPGGRAGHLIAARDLEKPFSFDAAGFSGGSSRNSIPLYDFATRQIVLHNYKGPLRTSALRSLGAYANIFALESFVDELALKAGKDPIEFRLLHLKDERAKEVINVLAQKIAWGKQELKAGTAIGFAFAQYKNEAAYFAVAAEVKVDPAAKKFRVVKLTGCIDAGQIINSDGIKNQTSGGMIQAASWTLLESVQYNADGILSTGWDSYSILRFADVPDTEVIIIDRPQQEPLGAGEAAQGPTAAAIGNAIFRATGSRLRELPLTADKIEWERS
jgi:CO/xanthine dehydrogenase Mo-binding subunit